MAMLGVCVILAMVAIGTGIYVSGSNRNFLDSAISKFEDESRIREQLYGDVAKLFPVGTRWNMVIDRLEAIGMSCEFERSVNRYVCLYRRQVGWADRVPYLSEIVTSKIYEVRISIATFRDFVRDYHVSVLRAE
tara:strand:- start:258 stop:659 length:402 start_codon:yes stop_codon:yes gene_type:complete